jgi:hypothetical protein
MNFLEAWKEAQGRRIVLTDTGRIIQTTNNLKTFLLDNLETIKTKDLISNNWTVKIDIVPIWAVTCKFIESDFYYSFIFKDRDTMNKWKEFNKDKVKILGTERYSDEI